MGCERVDLGRGDSAVRVLGGTRAGWCACGVVHELVAGGQGDSRKLWGSGGTGPEGVTSRRVYIRWVHVGDPAAPGRGEGEGEEGRENYDRAPPPTGAGRSMVSPRTPVVS